MGKSVKEQLKRNTKAFEDNHKLMADYFADHPAEKELAKRIESSLHNGDDTIRDEDFEEIIRRRDAAIYNYAEKVLSRQGIYHPIHGEEILNLAQ